jgi:tetratricopeptide (TPR) repeat protein
MERYSSAEKVLFQKDSKIKSSETLNLGLQILMGIQDYKKAIELYTKNENFADLYSICLNLENTTLVGNLKIAENMVLKLNKNRTESLNRCGDYLNYVLGHFYYKVGQYQKAITLLDDYYKHNSLSWPLRTTLKFPSPKYK